MTDHTYDMSQAMQNIGYNQGTNLGYYVGAETLKQKWIYNFLIKISLAIYYF